MPIVDIPEAEEPIEVPLDAIDTQEEEDVVIKEQEEFDSIIQSRINRERNNLRDKLKEDEDFFREAANERGIELRDDGRPKGSVKDEELRELKEKASRVDTLEEKVQEYESTIQETREQRLEQDLLDKAPPAANETAQETFVREAKSRMTYDDEYGWVRTDENGDIEYSAGEPVGPDQVIAELEDTHEFLFESTEVDGGSDVNPGASATGRRLTKSEFEQEVKKARQQGDQDRMDELAQMEAEGKIIDE
jgi:hypothetical protein